MHVTWLLPDLKWKSCVFKVCLSSHVGNYVNFDFPLIKNVDAKHCYGSDQRNCVICIATHLVKQNSFSFAMPYVSFLQACQLIKNPAQITNILFLFEIITILGIEKL